MNQLPSPFPVVVAILALSVTCLEICILGIVIRRGTFVCHYRKYIHIEHVFILHYSYKKPLTNMNMNNPIYSKSNSSAALSVGRRLLHNRLRSNCGTGQQQQLSLSPSSSMMASSSSFAPRSPAPLPVHEEKAVCRAHSYEQRTSSCKLNSTGKSSDGTVTYDDHCSPPGHIYSNLSVIPQLSSALFSSAPITALNLNPNAAGNSPEVNLRNLLLQLSSQQHQQLPPLQQNISTVVPPKNTVNDLCDAHFSSELSSSDTTWHDSSSLIDSMLTDSSCSCPSITRKDNNEEKSSCCYADDQVN